MNKRRLQTETIIPVRVNDGLALKLRQLADLSRTTIEQVVLRFVRDGVDDMKAVLDETDEK